MARRPLPMSYELTATTHAGERLLVLAEVLAGDLASRAAEHDRDRSYPQDSIVSLRDTGYFAAAVPPEHGGLGAESVHDHVVASSRLARGDASVPLGVDMQPIAVLHTARRHPRGAAPAALGVNMHTTAVLNMARRRRIALTRGDERRVAAFGRSLESI